LVLVALGLWLRIWGYEQPAGFTFDEHHFVENARNYLKGVPDWNDHPPLGKLTEAAAMRALDDSARAWRLPALLSGLGIVALAGLLAHKIFRSCWAALFAAALIACDGFFIAYSRTGLLDGQLVFFTLASTYAVVGAPRRAHFFFAGVLAGAAASIKMSGVAALGPVFLAVLLDRSRATFISLGLAFVAFLVVYWADWHLGLALTHRLDANAWSETSRLMTHHAALTSMDNGLTSSWPTWFFPRRPIVMTWSEERAYVRMATTMGNPLVWWATSATVLGLLGLVCWKGVRQTLAKPTAVEPTVTEPTATEPTATAIERSSFLDRHGRAVIFLLTGFLAFLAPWMLTRRDPYIYHYLPCYAYGVILLGGLLAWLAERQRRFVLLALCSVLVVSAFYAPVWARLPTTNTGVRARLFLESWR